jgi:23S rRNA (cytosine1962-C5)-methyltransferase
MSRTPNLPQVQVDKRSAAALREGHPWVWPDALEGLARPPRLGQEVEVLDSVGAFIGRGLVDSGDGPAIRIFTRDERDPPLRKLLFRRVASARRLRERLLLPHTDAFRLLHGEGDQLPGLVVDRYGPILVLRPDGQLWDGRLADVVEALRSEGGAGIETILLKPREGETRLLSGATAPAELVVSEEGRRYVVRPGQGQKTGFFLDQRNTRNLVQRLVQPGDHCLNLFSFTGGFSVAMGLGGAAEVTSVDLSDSILADCRAQFPLNGLDAAAHHFVAADIFEWLPKQSRGRAPQSYDLIVCDPPAMARKRSQVERARAAYRRLHAGIAPLLKKDSLLVTCSCTARLGAEELLEDARTGLREGGRRVSRIVYSGGAGGDHPIAPGFTEGHYLSCLVLAVE